MQKKLSQKELAEMVGISAPSYCLIENGKTNPTISHAKKIANILRFNVLKFYEDRE
jgi:DNA-binding XRE family transcriptional regulator